MFDLGLHYLLMSLFWDARNTGTDPEGFLRGFDLLILLYLLSVFGQTGLSKQCSPRPDAAERGV